MLLAKRTEMIAKLDVIPTKHYATQAYASVSSGATRMEEAISSAAWPCEGGTRDR